MESKSDFEIAVVMPILPDLQLKQEEIGQTLENPTKYRDNSDPVMSGHVLLL